MATKKNKYQRFTEMVQEIHAPKNQYNSFGKYNYRNVEDIQDAVKPVMLEHGILITVRDELVLIGDRYYVKATAEAIDTESGEVITFATAYAREDLSKTGMAVSQLTGATSSYARKYALGGLLLLDDTKDADSQKPEEPKSKTGGNSDRVAMWNNFDAKVKAISGGALNGKGLLKAKKLKGDEAYDYVADMLNNAKQLDAEIKEVLA
jgi:hypothetical protein